MKERIGIIEYALNVAREVSRRSPDPYRKVGAVILDKDNRIISTGYNGLMSGFEPPPNFWVDKEYRKPFMIHAEINALSYIKKNEGNMLVCTLKPCEHCLIACVAHGIKTIWYDETKDNLQASDLIAKTYGLAFNRISMFNVK